MTLNVSITTPLVDEIGESLLETSVPLSVSDPSHLSLAKMYPGDEGWIVHVEEGNHAIMGRLLEMGLIEGSYIEVMHQAPFGGDPIAVKVRGGLIALRRHEAQSIRVRKAKL